MVSPTSIYNNTPPPPTKLKLSHVTIPFSLPSAKTWCGIRACSCTLFSRTEVEWPLCSTAHCFAARYTVE